MDRTPDWITAKNEASAERAYTYLRRDLEKAYEEIKRLKKKIKDLRKLRK
jgi:5-bromo-4-chloroindolyl phosphate hydrolysis protein